MTARPATVLVSPILPLWVGWQEAMRTAAGEGGDRKGPRHGHCRTRGTRWTRAEGGRERQSCHGGWCRSRGDQQSYAAAAASPPRGPTTTKLLTAGYPHGGPLVRCLLALLLLPAALSLLRWRRRSCNAGPPLACLASRPPRAQVTRPFRGDSR